VILVAEMREEEMFSSKPNEQMELKKLSFSSSAPLRSASGLARAWPKGAYIYPYCIYIYPLNLDRGH
jgi:hypothetical protein